MLLLKSRLFWDAMFHGESGDYVKKLLTDGKWEPDYGPAPLAFKIGFTVFLIILAGAVVFGTWKLLEWVWPF